MFKVIVAVYVSAELDFIRFEKFRPLCGNFNEILLYESQSLRRIIGFAESVVINRLTVRRHNELHKVKVKRILLCIVIYYGEETSVTADISYDSSFGDISAFADHCGIIEEINLKIFVLTL